MLKYEQTLREKILMRIEQSIVDYNILRDAAAKFNANPDTFKNFSQADKLKLGAINFKAMTIPTEILLLCDILEKDLNTKEISFSAETLAQIEGFRETLGNLVKVSNGELIFDNKIKPFIDAN